MSRGPISVNGLGTAYYGKRDFGRDGSFITTEWFIFFHVPIIPLRSYRVISHGRESIVGPFYEKEHYSLSKASRPNFKQVVSTYAYTIALGALAFYLVSNFEALAQRFTTAGVVAGAIVCGIAFLLVPGFFRGLALRRAGLKRVRRRRR